MNPPAPPDAGVSVSLIRPGSRGAGGRADTAPMNRTLPAPTAFSGVLWLPTVLLLAGFWLLNFNQQRLEWTVNAVYSYGWAVPALALFLLYERWRRRPEAGPRLSPAAVAAVAALLLAAYLPVRVIQEANPDWVKINWLMAALAAGLSLLAFAAIGGRRYALFFAFPILFCFSALPWPVWMETYLIQQLMRGNATIAAEVLTLAGIPALAEGNLIQIGASIVNVEEACSGIRSLQTAFMMALFLGEFHRLSVLRRIGLMAASFALAFAINLGRTLVLTYLARDGAAARDWHDEVGAAAMVICLAGMWLVSEAFRPGGAAAPAETGRTGPRFGAPFPLWLATAGCGWLAFAEWGNAYWYRHHEVRVPAAAGWHVAWPENAPRFRRGEFAERTLALLKFDRGETASWRVEDRYGWQMYCLDWAPGRVSKFLSRSHYPTVCLPATGLELVAETGPWDCAVGDLRIPFATYLFQAEDRNVHVFHAIVEARAAVPGEHLAYRQVDSTERLISVWRGERNLGQHVIGIALHGAESAPAARAIVARALQTLIRPDPVRTIALSP